MNKLLLSLCLACPLWALAAPVEPGHPLPGLQLKNQHDQDWRIAPDTKLVLFAAGRKASNLMQTVLAPQPKGFLAGRHAVYLADMSRMPGFIKDLLIRGWAERQHRKILADFKALAEAKVPAGT